MMIMLFPLPLFLGVLFASVGWLRGNRWFRITGDALLAIGLLIMVIQVYTIREWYYLNTPDVGYGLFLDDLTDYIAFIGFSLMAGLLAGDGLLQLVRKKSSSS